MVRRIALPLIGTYMSCNPEHDYKLLNLIFNGELLCL